MTALLVENGVVVLPDGLIEPGAVASVDGRIVGVGRRVRRPRGATVVDARGGFIVPGFVDIHVHGGAGADFMDGSVDAVRTALMAHARHGTTTLFPTTSTGSPARIRGMLAACRAARDGWEPGQGGRIGGVHLYGPYFAADKVGCHDPAGRRDPDPREYRDWFADGLVRIATCAAELPGAVEFCRLARRHGCLVTCGHSNSTWRELQATFDAGMRHVDHFWCAMSSVASLRSRCGAPMQAGMEQFVLAVPEMSTEVIADGHHLAPELLEFAFRMIGPRRLCLVTDSSRALDMPPGRYRFGPAADGPEFTSDGKVGRVEGRLASSVVGMDHMVRRMLRDTSATLCDVIRMASLTPAERAGIAAETGSLEPGKRADVVVLSGRLSVRRVFVGGVEVAFPRRRG
ncbi:MAG: N-acetylglucosamine-6-phosphate deacetylase [Planctomycetia bacterium]